MMKSESRVKIIMLAILPLMMFAGSVATAAAKNRSFSPFTQMAALPAVIDADGQVDHVATYERTGAVAKAIARYIASYYEPDEIGADVIQGGNWVVAGFEDAGNPEDFEARLAKSILSVPSKQTIVPGQILSKDTIKKVKIIEVCNKTYASKALGVLPIAGTQKVANGLIHGPALPCEISVHNEGDQIFVNVLNPMAIFTLYFTDVITGAQMDDEDFARKMRVLPGQIDSELRAIIMAALAEYEAQSGVASIETSWMGGPVFHNLGQAISAVAASENHSPFVHIAYTKADATSFTDAEIDTIVATIMETMTIHGEPNAGQQEEPLRGWLAPNASWRSARHKALKMPGGNRLVEVCSPLYAKMAMGKDYLDHAAALPCAITFNKTDGGATLLVSILDPNFIFGVMFADMTDEEKEAIGDLPNDILADLETMIDYAIDHKLYEITLNPGEEVYYPMTD